ncbi:MAG: sodium:solute symporter family protein [Candidatus Electryonea clarkiae]|nr:sodium:solute symporter family protein [Candidatus Electryonea clarkiae]MDP8287059.1 sodium:solute symporter family protein [Candidatus Electryonea clarkiae]
MNGNALPRLGLLDSGIVGLYLILLWVIAIRSRRRDNSGEDFLLAGRKLTIPAFIATLVTTWYGGILGIGEFGWKYGISTWIVFGLPYYLHAIVFAIFIAPRSARSKFINLPDQLEKAYNSKTALVGATLLLITTIPAAYLLMLGTLLRMIIPVPEIVAIILGAAISITYLWSGGFRAVVRTDKLQFGLMFGGFFILLLFCFSTLSPFELPARLPPSHLTWHGGHTTAYIILWYIVAAQTYIEPTFHQRCYAAKSAKVARWGTLFSIVAWLIFDLMTTMAALYSRVLLPDLTNPVASFPSLAVLILPVGLLGLFVAGMLATVMSTVDSYSFLAAVTFGRDIVGRYRRKIDDESINRLVRISLVFISAAGILLAAWKGSVIEIWKLLGSISAPALIIPIVSSFWERSKMSPVGALTTMILSAVIVLVWIAGSYLTKSDGYWLGIEPIYIGMAVSMFCYGIDLIIRKLLSGQLTDRNNGI